MELCKMRYNVKNFQLSVVKQLCEKTICDEIVSRDSIHGVPYAPSDRLVTLKTEDVQMTVLP